MREFSAGNAFLLLMGFVLSETAHQRCDMTWQYHNQRDTCLKPFHTRKEYYIARNTCKNYTGGSEIRVPGHLVYILDEDMDNIVKGLLKDGKVTQSWIGIHDRVRGGLYQWGDPEEYPVGNYSGWKSLDHKPDQGNKKSSVIITQEGWEEYDGRSRVNFVCQVKTAAPEYCSTRTSNPRFAAVVDTNLTVELCVLAYPRPTSFTLYQENSTGQLVNVSNYEISFDYTNETTGEREISVIISSLRQQDFGHYQIYFEYRPKNLNRIVHYSYLKFQLSPEGPPECPTNFKAEEIKRDLITLSWKPGFDGGLPQNFTLVIYEINNNMSWPPVNITTLPENSTDSMRYNVTDLTERTNYTFGILVENRLGASDCSNVTLKVFTSGRAAIGNIVVIIVVSLIIGVALLILGFVCVLKHCGRSGTMPVTQ